MPQLVRRKFRLESPSFFAVPSANSFSRASNWRCCGVCGKGLNSPLETIRVGTGERNAARSAGRVRANSRLLRNPVIVVLPKAFDFAGALHAATDFSECSALIGSAMFARVPPGVN
jgi:hypothetical protein